MGNQFQARQEVRGDETPRLRTVAGLEGMQLPIIGPCKDDPS